MCSAHSPGPSPSSPGDSVSVFRATRRLKLVLFPLYTFALSRRWSTVRLWKGTVPGAAEIAVRDSGPYGKVAA